MSCSGFLHRSKQGGSANETTAHTVRCSHRDFTLPALNAAQLQPFSHDFCVLLTLLETAAPFVAILPLYCSMLYTS